MKGRDACASNVNRRKDSTTPKSPTPTPKSPYQGDFYGHGSRSLSFSSLFQTLLEMHVHVIQRAKAPAHGCRYLSSLGSGWPVSPRPFRRRGRALSAPPSSGRVWPLTSPCPFALRRQALLCLRRAPQPCGPHALDDVLLIGKRQMFGWGNVTDEIGPRTSRPEPRLWPRIYGHSPRQYRL